MKKKPETPLKRGSVILTELPFVFVLKASNRQERCDYCLQKVSDLRKCGGCRYVLYCDAVCQKDAWEESHRMECPGLAAAVKLKREVPDAARIVAKIVRKLNNGGDLQRGYYTKHDYRKFRDLMSHYQEIRSDKRRMEHVEAIGIVLRTILGADPFPNESELLQIYGRLCTNGFNILDEEMNSIATGIYLGVSILDHSCTPNAVATFEGKKISIRLLEDMPCLDWSKIFISYIDLMNTREDRREELKRAYYFLCTCSRCVDASETEQMMAASCPESACKEPLVLKNGISECSACGSKPSAEFCAQFNEVLEFTKEKLAEMKEIAYLDVSKLCLKRHTGIFHPLNVWHLKTLDSAFESALTIQKWDDALEFGLKLYPGFKLYHGPFNPLVGLLHLKLGKLLLYLERPKDALVHLKSALEIIKVTHGDRNTLLKDNLFPLLAEATALLNN